MAYDPVALFARACELLDRDLGLELRELAAELKVHRHTLEKVIQSEVGCGFIAWRQEPRLASARHLLTDPSMSEKEVAHRVGLTPGSLDRLFGRVFKLTPTEFRESSHRRHKKPTGRARRAELAARRRKRTRG
jgi:AraC-like DNA-binding protein